MVHENLGRKQRCASCGIKFYDLRKKPVVCPACGAEFDSEVLIKSRRGRSAKVDEVKAPVKEDDTSDVDLVEEADDGEFESGDEVLSSEDGLMSIATDDDDDSDASGAELIDVLDDDLVEDDDVESDDDQ